MITLFCLCSQSNLYISSYESGRRTQTDRHTWWENRTLLNAHGVDAVSLAVLLQAQLLFMQVHRSGVDSCALQVQTDPLTPQPPEQGKQRTISYTSGPFFKNSQALSEFTENNATGINKMKTTDKSSDLVNNDHLVTVQRSDGKRVATQVGRCRLNFLNGIM